MRRAAAAVALVVAALLAWQVWESPSREGEKAVDPAPAPVAPPPVADSRPETSPVARPDPAPETGIPASPVYGTVDADPGGGVTSRWPSLQEQTERVRQRIHDWTFEDYQRWLAERSALSGEDAYQAYRFAAACVGGVTSEAELLRRSAQYREYARHNAQQVSAERLERALGQIERSFVHCEGMGEGVLSDAIDWLLLAADLDYLPAQVAFADALPTLLERVRWTTFRQPELVILYRDQAPLLLERAMASGHPDAFRAQARALDRGLAYDRDPVAATAYEMLAERIEFGAFPRRPTGRGLDAEQSRRAEALAAELCRRHCP